MATIIYKPPTKGIGEGLGELLGAYTASKIRDSRQTNRSEAIAQYLEEINRSPTPQIPGDASAQVGDVEQERRRQTTAKVNPDDLLKLLMLAKQGQKDLTKVDAYNKEGKKTPFATTKAKLASGEGETDAGKRGLTLVDPEKTKPGKPTDTDKAISDLLRSKQLPRTASNKVKARSFLKDRRKAEDVINRSFGKKIGQDWMIEAGTKKEMADLATSQVEGLIFDEGLSAEQAGTVAVKIAQESFKSRVEEEQAPLIPLGTINETNIVYPNTMTDQNEIANYVADTYKIPIQEVKTWMKKNTGQKDEGIFSQIQSLISGDRGQQQETLESLGNINGIDVSYPSTMSNPREIADYISKTYNMPFEDVRAWMIENQPVEQ